MDRGLAAATAAAAGCAEAMQAALGRFAAAERLPLALRIGIGAGEVVVLDVGGERERRELLVAGAAVPQTTGAAERARPGQVLLARPALDLVERAPGAPTATGRPAGRGRARGGAALVAPYLPRAMLASMVAGHEEWLAELRQITVVFANLPDLDHRAGLDEADEVMRALQSALYRYEGSINKLSVDEKGTSLVAALGLPPLTHEDDPARGVQAALAMRETLAGLGRRVAIGVTTGRAFCGTVGSRRRREYTMLGAVVNLAARLMQEAGDGVLCDAATAEAARSALAFESLGAGAGQGPGRPGAGVPPGARRPVRRPGAGAGGPGARWSGGRRSGGGWTGPCGRLTADGDDRPGGVQVLVLEGEAGAGKSRLVAELVDQAVAAGVPVLAGAGDAVERNTPWHAWRELFGRLPAFDGTDRADRRRLVLDLLGPGPELRDLAPLLNPVLALELPETAASAELSGQGRAGRTRDLLVRLLRAVVGDKPTVLVIEDAHWLDSASTGLVLALSRERLPLLLVVATRSRGEGGTVEDELAWAAYRRLLRAPEPRAAGPGPALRGGGRGPGRPAARHHRGPRGPRPAGRGEGRGQPAVHRGAGPRPARRRPGPGGRRPGRARSPTSPTCWPGACPRPSTGPSPAGSTGSAPPSSSPSRWPASSAGCSPSVILRDIHPLRQAVALTLTADLSELERADLTVLDTPEPDLSYLFKHVIAQEAAYNLMLLSQRRQLHRSVAEWYERAGGGDLALLAHHWRLAEVPAKAVHYLERAGTEALREGAYAEAVRFFTALLEVDDGDLSGRRPAAARAGPAPRPSAGPAGSTSSATPTWVSASSRPSRSTCTPPWPCSGAGPRPAAAGSRASWPGRPASSSATGSGRGPWSPAPPRPGPPSRRRPRSTSACSWSTTTPASGPRRCTRRSRA